jgi:hypothetical protein
MCFKKTDPQELLSSFLLPNETLLWSGQPMQGVIWTVENVAILIASVLIFPVAGIVFAIMCIQNGNTDSVIFLCSGAWLLLGGIAIHSQIYPDNWERTNTFYGITADRIMICKNAMKPAVLSINFKSLKQVRLVQLGHGTGYILLGPNMPRLQTIQEVGKPYQLILELQQT